MKKKGKCKEKQYLLEVTATFVVVGNSLQEAQKNLDHHLSGLSTVDFKIHSGQAMIPQICHKEIPQYEANAN